MANPVWQSAKKNSYDVRGYETLEDYEMGYQAVYIDGNLTNKREALRIAKKSLKDYLIVKVVDDVCDTGIFSNNKLLLRWIQIGPGSIPKKELPLLIGIDPLLDTYITGILKE